MSDDTALSASRNPKVVELLLNAGANINHQNIHGMTALMIAAKHGRFEVVKILIEHKADERLKDADGLTAVDWAKYDPNEKVRGLGGDPGALEFALKLGLGDENEMRAKEKILELLKTA
ncbi:ankyrin repeat domain-containing protein [Bdellovibrionota bacterium FG-2]